MAFPYDVTGPRTIAPVAKPREGISIAELKTNAENGLRVDTFAPARPGDNVAEILGRVNTDSDPLRVSCTEIKASLDKMQTDIAALANNPNATKEDLAKAQQIYGQFQSLLPYYQQAYGAQQFQAASYNVAIQADQKGLGGDGNGRLSANEVNTFMARVKELGDKSTDPNFKNVAAQYQQLGLNLIEVIKMHDQQLQEVRPLRGPF